MKSIVDWFDPDNLEHLEALHELEINGRWPEWFEIPAEVGFPSMWQTALYGKIARRYIDSKLDN